MFAWIVLVQWLARLIFALLIALSIWSVRIMLERKKYFASLKLDPSKDFVEQADQNAFFAQARASLSTASTPESVERKYQNHLHLISKDLQKDLASLGTLGSISPFIGLLGTVCGIIAAFGDLSQGTQNTNQMMFSLAEALLLTAVGLGVAIPAVVAYNYFSRQVKEVLSHLTCLKNEHLESMES
ncbi:MAG: MotA/TolQ/ExbB proton channel family protein [Bdellovibrionales bacterium]|nr:MotA/TolQ/ExbB proton channel family protein [Bdellovibrionales bacterium]